MWSERLTSFLHRYRVVLFAIWLTHTFLLHYFVLGFISWDGFGHRGFPLVELVQHGTMGKDKFNEWSLVGYTPFVELAQLPFVKVFRMRGFLIAFPLVVFPLCVAAVFRFLRELTSDHKAATYGAFAYAAMPMINQQPYSAYIDFSVSGLLSLFLFALLRLRRPEVRAWSYVALLVATWLFTMARVQAVYVVIVLFPLLAYVLFIERERFKLRIPDKRKLIFASLATALGSVPAVALQVYKYLEFGSPTYPVQFSMLGIKIGSGGLTRDYYFKLAGIGGDGLASVSKGFFEGWVWHGGWPIGGFYTSKYMAAGLLFLLAAALLPFVVRKLTRLEWWLIGGFGLVSFLARDFGVPRWSYTIVVALALILGRAMSELSGSKRWRPVFWIALAVMAAHLLRPEVDYLQIKHHQVSPRMNAGSSPHFIHSYDVPIFPDVRGKFVIIETPWNNFILPIYGTRLSNVIIETVKGAEVGPKCESLRGFVEREPQVLFIDDYDHMKDCPKECGLTLNSSCRGYRLLPATP